MVHALEEIHRLLRADGRLIDIHPFAEAPGIEVHQAGKIIFSEPMPIDYVRDIEEAEKALVHVVKHGLFAVERAQAFDFRVYAPSVSELSDFFVEAGACETTPPDEAVVAQQAELAARVDGVTQAAGEGTDVAYYERVRIARLVPL